MEKVALMPGIAAYVYTKSGNLSSYGWCNAWGGGRGGQGSHCQPPFSNYTGSFGRRRSLSIGWEEHGALQAANVVLGSKCSEILIRQSNGLNACRGVDPHQRFIKTSVFVSFSVCGRLHLQQRSQPQSAVTSLERGV